MQQLINPSDACHFTWGGKQFEIRITDDGTQIELWTVEVEQGDVLGFDEFIASFNIKPGVN